MTETKELVAYRRSLDGDTAALETLVKTYGDSLVRFAYCFVKDSATAEDIMEDAFASLLVKRRAFSCAEKLRAYLYKSVRNKAIDYLRFHRRHTPIEDVERVLVGGDLEADVVKRARNRALYRSIQALPAQYAEVVYLVYFEGREIDEACILLKKSKKQVYNLLARAKTSLKELLKKEGISYEDV